MRWFRDVASLAGLLSLLRIPLAVVFPFAVHEPFAAVSILAAAGLSDVLDGWWARTTGRATSTGAVLDGIMDKLFVMTATLTLIVVGKLPLPAALLVGVRDIAELPLVLWFILAPGARRAAPQKANVFGKIVTVLQFATLTAAIFGYRHVLALSLVTAIGGAFAASVYLARTLGQLGVTGPGVLPGSGKHP